MHTPYSVHGNQFSNNNISCKYYKCSSADVDLVVHAAGPFQQAENCNVLEVAIETKVRKGNYYVKFSSLLCFLSLIYVIIISMFMTLQFNQELSHEVFVLSPNRLLIWMFVMIPAMHCVRNP